MLELVEISKAVDGVYKAISAPRRRQRQHTREIRRFEPRVARASREYMEFLQKEINKGSRQLRGKTPAKIVDSITDWKNIVDGRLVYQMQVFTIYS